jgi:hypothetical protein
MESVEKPKRGGPQPGSGRPRKAVRNAAELAQAEGKILSAAPEMIDLLIKAAREGDTTAARYLCDRAFGRPSEEPSPLAVRVQAREGGEPEPATVDGVLRSLAEAVAEVRASALDPSKKSAALARLGAEMLRAIEVGELAGQLRELREMVAQREVHR